MSSGQGRSVTPAWRRSRRASTYFLIGILVVSAAGAGYLWRRSLATRLVCVAAADLPAYQQITAADIHTAEVRADDVPAQAAASPRSLIGRYTLAAVQRGQPFDLAELGPRLPAGILRQKLVVGLPASAAVIADGTVTLGARVDILLSSSAPAGTRSGVLRRALVLNVARARVQGQ